MLYKEDTHTHTQEYYSAIKRNKIIPFAATWMGSREILSEVSEKQTSYDITYVESKKKDKKKKRHKWSYCRTEGDSQTPSTNLGLPKETSGGGRLGMCNWHMRTIYWVPGQWGPAVQHRDLDPINSLWSSVWEKSLKEKGCVSLCNWIPLLYSRDDHTSSINSTFFKMGKKKKAGFSDTAYNLYSGLSLHVLKKTDKKTKQNLYPQSTFILIEIAP